MKSKYELGETVITFENKSYIYDDNKKRKRYWTLIGEIEKVSLTKKGYEYTICGETMKEEDVYNLDSVQDFINKFKGDE